MQNSGTDSVKAFWNRRFSKHPFDPNELIAFFEKLQSKEKKKPGTVSKLFMSHPTTDKRIEKVRELTGRFPEHKEYTVSSAEFGRVKDRLQQVTKARFSDTEDSKRPTLKRRRSEESDRTEPGVEKQDEPQQSPDRPTLRRRSDGESPNGEGQTQPLGAVGQEVNE